MKKANRNAKAFRETIVGQTGTGKSTYIEEILKMYDKRWQIVIHDPQDEYTATEENELVIKRTQGHKEKVLSIISDERVHNTLIVLDDATLFLGKKIKADPLEKFLSAMASSRHRNIHFIFVFHAFKLINTDLASMMTGIRIFKTGDKERYVKQYWEEFLDEWKKVMLSDNKYENIRIKLS